MHEKNYFLINFNKFVLFLILLISVNSTFAQDDDYYEEPEEFVNDLPKDDTWIVVYCACPHAASQRVVNTLKRYGYKNTAIIDEGVLVWAQLGYPVNHGQ